VTPHSAVRGGNAAACRNESVGRPVEQAEAGRCPSGWSACRSRVHRFTLMSRQASGMCLPWCWAGLPPSGQPRSSWSQPSSMHGRSAAAARSLEYPARRTSSDSTTWSVAPRDYVELSLRCSQGLMDRHAAPRMPRPPPDPWSTQPRGSAAGVPRALLRPPSTPNASSAPARRLRSPALRIDYSAVATRSTRWAHSRVPATRSSTAGIGEDTTAGTALFR
jgi:hypothetical protein